MAKETKKTNKKITNKKSKTSPKAKSMNMKIVFQRIALALTIAFFIAIAALIFFGMPYLDNYVDKRVITTMNSQADISLVRDARDKKFVRPEWVTQEIESRVIKTAMDVAGTGTVEPAAAILIGEELSRGMEWLSEVKVKTTRNGIDIYVVYRKPIAKIDYKGKTYYLDKDLYVLSYYQVDSLDIVKITGFKTRQAPQLGSKFRVDQLAAAVTLINLCGNMDTVLDAKPLLSEIASIDTSKFNSQSIKDSKLTMVVTDGTKIFWGEPVDPTNIKAEATDKEKLMRLYGFFERYGTLRGTAKSLDLRRPAGMVPFAPQN